MTQDLAPNGTIKDQYQQFIALSRYARWRDEDFRRETWSESVDRYLGFMLDHLGRAHGYAPGQNLVDSVRTAIIARDVVPSMRALMTAGPALERSHIAGYNCAFIAVDHPRALDEALYISMNGTGVGFSVEARHIDQLPAVPTLNGEGPLVVVEDSKEGWATAFRQVLEALWGGTIPSWDLSLVRPAGAKLATFGGRASGPAPLDALLEFTVDTFFQAEGRRLRPIEVHDIMCKMGDCVVSGGVRRSALISLSDLNDYDLAKAKSGNWWEKEGHRALANNSAVYHSRPKSTQFLREWRNLIESNSGERGIFNLAGAREKATRAGRNGNLIEGVNPCGEILLRSAQFCNLTEVIIRPEDTEATLADKIRVASILGTWQSTLTDFPYLRDVWRENTEDERLLGVSLTGIYGNPILNDPSDPGLPDRLHRLRDVAQVTNWIEAEDIGISRSKAVTTVKPSGTVSQLAGVSSGIHPWYSKHYARTVRGNNDDPMTKLLKEYEVPNEPDITKPDTTTVFSFPMAAPEGAKTRDQISALDHLRLWSTYREHWTDHNPSVTISVREHEWIEVGNWVYSNWDKVGGISFLPYEDHSYKQAPYQPLTELEYDKLVAEMPEEIYWYDLSIHETQDTTSGSQSFACAADGCDIADIGQS